MDAGMSDGRPIVAGGEPPIPSVTVAVLLVEDDAIVRAWLRESLRETEFRVAGEASTVADAHRIALRRRVDVLVIDQHLPDALGTDLARQLRAEGIAAPMVLMTASSSRGLNEMAREAGIQASVVKSSDRDELLGVLRATLHGQSVFDAAHPRRQEGEAPLAPREREIVKLVSEGLTNRQIAARLGIGDETVKTYLERAYTKLGVRRRAEAVAAAKTRGIL